MALAEEILKAHIDEYLGQGKLLHLATLMDDRPWLCHVWYACGPGNSLVFTSNKARRHSREISANASVAGGVISIPLEGLGQAVRGLSFEGRACEASGDGIHTAYEVYASRWPMVRDMFSARDIETGASNMRMYLISMTRIVMFDEVNYRENPRQELRLEVA